MEKNDGRFALGDRGRESSGGEAGTICPSGHSYQ